MQRSRTAIALALAAFAAWGCGDSATPGGDAAPPTSGDWFVDVAEESGLRFEHEAGRSGRFYTSEIVGPGVALFDYDGDGDLDVYLVQGGSLDEGGPQPSGPGDRLFRNDLEKGELRFTDVTEAARIDARGYGMGVAAGDYDGDGRVDLYVTNFGPNQLWRNAGDGTFEDVTARAGAGLDDPRWSTSAAFLDYDADGHLDLFVTSYVDFRLAGHRSCAGISGRPDYCGPGPYGQTPDRLFRNRGDGTFEDVSGPAGLLEKAGSGLGVVAADFDHDGRIDIFVANDRRPNFLWQNRGDGTFRERAVVAGTAVDLNGRIEASTGVDAGDFDNDGDDDLFVAHLGGESHTLYVNRGGGRFEDRTPMARLAASRTDSGSGTAWVDLDNDGWLDLVSANGAGSVMETLAAAGDPVPFHQRNRILRNDGAGGFEDVSPAAGEALGLSEVSRGTAVGDVDNDGDADLLIVNNDGPARLLVNGRGHARGWLGLRLVSGEPARDQLHARVEVWLPSGERRYRRARADASFLSSNDPRVLVGLADAREVDRVRVHWPSGQSEEWTGVVAGRYTTLREGSGSALGGEG